MLNYTLAGLSLNQNLNMLIIAPGFYCQQACRFHHLFSLNLKLSLFLETSIDCRFISSFLQYMKANPPLSMTSWHQNYGANCPNKSNWLEYEVTKDIYLYLSFVNIEFLPVNPVDEWHTDWMFGQWNDWKVIIIRSEARQANIYPATALWGDSTLNKLQ